MQNDDSPKDSEAELLGKKVTSAFISAVRY